MFSYRYRQAIFLNQFNHLNLLSTEGKLAQVLRQFGYDVWIV
ncbi:hypothetical protein [Nostoc sp.]